MKELKIFCKKSPPLIESGGVAYCRRPSSAAATTVAVNENDRHDEDPNPVIVYKIAKTVVHSVTYPFKI